MFWENVIHSHNIIFSIKEIQYKITRNEEMIRMCSRSMQNFFHIFPLQILSISELFYSYWFLIKTYYFKNLEDIYFFCIKNTIFYLSRISINRHENRFTFFMSVVKVFYFLSLKNEIIVFITTLSIPNFATES